VHLSAEFSLLNPRSRLSCVNLEYHCLVGIFFFQTRHSTCVPGCVGLVPHRTLKQRRLPAATHRLELYTPSRLSPVLRMVGDTTPGDVTQLDTSCTNTLNLDRFHHYSIDASDCLTPALTVRRHVDLASTAIAGNGSHPFDAVILERNLRTFQAECSSRGQLCCAEHCGTCSTVKLHEGNGRRYCDLCRLKAVRALVSTPQLSEVCESEMGSQDSSLLIDDRWEMSLSEQLGGEHSELHAGLPTGVFDCDLRKKGFGSGDGNFDSSECIIDSKQCVSVLESPGEGVDERAKTCDSGRGTNSSGSGTGDEP